MIKRSSIPVVDIISVFFALLMYISGVLARIGLSDNINLFPLLLSLSVLLLPNALEPITKLPRALLQFLVLAVLLGLGWLSIFLDIKLSVFLYPLALIPLLFFVKNLKIRLNRTGIVSVSLMSFVLGLKLISVLWTTNSYLDPLAPQSYYLGRFHIDTLYLSNLTSMIKTYQVTSTGLFGLVPIEYHAASNYLIASFAELCDLSTIHFYNFAYPVIFIPLFVQTFFYASFFNFRRVPNGFKIVIGLLILFIAVSGFVPNGIGQKYLTLSTLNNHFISESYCISLILLFLFIEIYWPCLKSNQSRQNTSDNTVLILLIPMWIFIIGFAKISTGVILFSVFSYVVLRRKLIFQKVFLLSGGLTILSMLYVLYLTIESTRSETFWIQLGSFYKYYVSGSLLIYFLLNYCWLIFLLMLFIFLFRRARNYGKEALKICTDVEGLLRQNKINDALDQIPELKDRIRSKVKYDHLSRKEFDSGKYIGLEIIIVAAIVGVLPGLLMEIEGGSAAYFADVQSWLSIIALVYFTPFLIYKYYRELSQSKIAVTIICLALSFFIVREALSRGYYLFIKENMEMRANLMYNKENPFRLTGGDHVPIFEGGEMSGSVMRRIFKECMHPKTSPLFNEQVQKLKLPLLEEIRKLPRHVKKRSLLYCEDLAELPKFKDCSEAFYLSAFTEVALINGMYWKDCLPSGEYSWRYYTAFPKVISKEDGFKLAEEMGFSNVILLNLKNNNYEIVAL